MTTQSPCSLLRTGRLFVLRNSSHSNRSYSCSCPTSSGRARLQVRCSLSESEPVDKLEVLVLTKLKVLPGLLTQACGDKVNFIDVDFEKVEDSSETQQLLENASVIIADPPVFAPLAHRCLGLEWLQCTFAGCDAVLKGTEKRDFTCTRLGGVFGQRMAEYVLLHILAFERSLKKNFEMQVAREWNSGVGGCSPSEYREVSGLTVGIVGGSGSIGMEVGRFCRTFNMRVKQLCRTSTQETSSDENMFTAEQLPEFLEGCDVVVSILPSTAETRNFLSGDALKPCQGALFINVGRGDVIDEASIIGALEEGWIRHAVLDVFPVEPLPQESPLWTHPEVTITPHVAANTFPMDVVDTFSKNLGHYLDDKSTLEHVLDWEAGY